MKKLYTLLSVAAAILMPLIANAQSTEIDGVTYEVLSVDDHTCKTTAILANMTEATIPSKVNIEGTDYTVVQVSSFSSLWVANLPATVTQLPFISSYNYLQQVNIAEGNPSYKSLDGALYNADMTMLMRVPISWSLGPAGDGIGNLTFEIPSTVKSLDFHAMRSCRRIDHVIIPEGVESIGTSCFGLMPDLESIEIPNSVSSIAAGGAWQGCFAGCEKLKKVVIGNGLTEIPSSFLFQCGNLTEIEIGENVNAIAADAFSGCYSLRKVVCHSATPAPLTAQPFPEGALISSDAVLYVPQGAAAAYRAAEYWKDFRNITEVAAIDGIDADATQAEVECYYDLNGIRHAQPVKGINVVKRTDGTTGKIFVK